VISPFKIPFLFTTGNFSILYFLKIDCAFFKSVPSGAVMRLSRVINSLTGRFRLSSNLKSRFVKMPASFPSASTIGIPPMRFSCISFKALLIVASSFKVIGSKIRPLSLLFTFLTCAACSSILMFLCKNPSPPSLAKAIARFASVTVSIAALSIGIFSVIFFVRRVVVFTSRGNTSLYAGINKTSSKVNPSPKIFFEGAEGLFIVAMSKDMKTR